MAFNTNKMKFLAIRRLNWNNGKFYEVVMTLIAKDNCKKIIYYTHADKKTGIQSISLQLLFEKGKYKVLQYS